MSTRIFFNGQEYAGPEAMPEDVRKAYSETLVRLAEDKDQNGVPDVFEGGQPVPGIVQASIVVNGRSVDLDDVPEPLRALVRSGLRSVAGDPAQPASSADFLRRLDAIRDKLATILQFLSLVVAGGVLVIGTSMIRHMGASSRSQGGVVYVAIAMAIALAWAVGMFVSASRRLKR
jgi:hypothetical protein